MPRFGDHITNLESDDAIAGRHERVQELHALTKQKIQDEYGPFMVGPPKGTKWRSKDQLAKMGIVGIYKAT